MADPGGQERILREAEGGEQGEGGVEGKGVQMNFRFKKCAHKSEGFVSITSSSN